MSLALVVFAVLAAEPRPGTYLFKGGGGELVLSKQGRFHLAVVGANAHTCELEGTWKGTRGVTSGDDRCELALEATEQGVEVRPLTDEPCRSYCGARAWFDGLYLLPSKGCTTAEVKKARADFKDRYAKKQWKEGIALLTPLLACETIDGFELAWIRNDLALTQHHAGDDAGCLATLAPLDSYRDESDGPSGEPMYDELFKKLGKATRTNSKLCGYAPPPK